MNYNDYRDKIRTGDVIAYSLSGWDVKNKFILDAIRVLTMSEYNHVGIAVVENDRVMLLEATRPYSRIYPLSKTGSFYHIPMNLEITDNSKLFKFIGLPYSYSKAIASLWSNPEPSSDLLSEGTYCTELCVRALREYGSTLDYRNGSTPGGFIETCLLYPNTSSSVFVFNKSSGSW